MNQDALVMVRRNWFWTICILLMLDFAALIHTGQAYRSVSQVIVLYRIIAVLYGRY